MEKNKNSFFFNRYLKNLSLADTCNYITLEVLSGLTSDKNIFVYNNKYFVYLHLFNLQISHIFCNASKYPNQALPL